VTVIPFRPRTSTAGRLTTAEQITAVFAHPGLYAMAGAVPPKDRVGRPRAFPSYLLLGFGALARVYRSGSRAAHELTDPATWRIVRDAVEAAAAEYDLDIALPGDRPPDWDAYRYARNHHLTVPDTLTAMRAAFTATAVDQARVFGLLDPSGPGSLCHPDPTRTVYGDGTVVRPMYRPPAARRTTDPATGQAVVTYLDAAGQPIDAPRRRFDPDAADYHGHTGSVHGQNFVAWSVRGPARHKRVVLAVDRVPRPGLEADTSVELLKALHAVAGSGIQAVAYDGAFRGRHIDEVMTGCGLVVINKVHASATTAARKGKTTNPRWHTLGTWEHDTDAGPCTHHLAAVDGAVSEIGLDEAGRQVVLHRLERKQVKRPRRTSGRYHFNVAYEVPCPAGPFQAWVTPHALADETDHRRADAVRVIAEGEAEFATLYGLRNDAESFNAQLKRTLLVDRAMSLGGARQLLDVLCFAHVHNATNALRAGALPVTATRGLRAAA
jgi:hypothetical protein